MSDLRELYQQVIIDHSKAPRNFSKLENSNRICEGFNPLCGDRIKVYAQVENDRVQAITFEGSGCAICMASASMMTDFVKGKSVRDAEKAFENFHNLITDSGPVENSLLGKLAVFEGVREFPVRVKCASLPWHTFKSALHGSDQSVSTE